MSPIMMIAKTLPGLQLGLNNRESTLVRLLIERSLILDKLNDQHLSYQLLVDEDVPNSVKESTGLDAEHPYRVDVLWHYLKNVKKKARNNRTRIRPTLPSC